MINYFKGRVNEVIKESDLSRINELIAGLYASVKPVDSVTFADFSEFPRTFIVVARDDQDGEQIAGMGLVTIMRKWGYRYGFVEDIIVHEKYRGTPDHIADGIMKKIEEVASENGAVQLDLNCGAQRLVAHKLYERNGYEKRGTVPFRKPLEKASPNVCL